MKRRAAQPSTGGGRAQSSSREPGNGLSSREVERRLTQYGPNAIVRRGRRRWWHEVGPQLTHPLALLLWAACVLAQFAGTAVLPAAIGR